MPNSPSGPSEAAIEAAIKMSKAGEAQGHTAKARGHDALIAAHSSHLGDARSVNEAWCREDERAKIRERMDMLGLFVTDESKTWQEAFKTLRHELGGSTDEH